VLFCLYGRETINDIYVVDVYVSGRYIFEFNDSMTAARTICRL